MDKSKPENQPLEAKRQRHTREFKIEAVRQLEEGKVSGTQLLLMLGVKRSIIYRWKKELATHGPDVSFPGKGETRTDEQTEIQRFKRQLAKEKRCQTKFSKSVEKGVSYIFHS
ncbi:transposase [Achromobacter sp. Marseille-Q4954]|uniref:transposase n=1 Tax=Achromobacter sp. Marseille-Q4954 TaxID=2942203 RepID=UPI00207348FB|nr:transposase [Achromobacter sp. Marseille-Q4954]